MVRREEEGADHVGEELVEALRGTRELLIALQVVAQEHFAFLLIQDLRETMKMEKIGAKERGGETFRKEREHAKNVKKRKKKQERGIGEDSERGRERAFSSAMTTLS